MKSDNLGESSSTHFRNASPLQASAVSSSIPRLDSISFTRKTFSDVSVDLDLFLSRTFAGDILLCYKTKRYRGIMEMNGSTRTYKIKLPYDKEKLHERMREKRKNGIAEFMIGKKLSEIHHYFHSSRSSPQYLTNRHES